MSSKWKISPFVDCGKYLKDEAKMALPEILYWYLVTVLFCLFVGIFING